MVDATTIECSAESILIVCEFLDVLPKEAPSMPPPKEVDFGIG